MPTLKKVNERIPPESECYDCPECYVEVVCTDLFMCEKKCQPHGLGKYRQKKEPEAKSNAITTGKNGQQTFT